MTTAETRVALKIRSMEPEDIEPVLEIDRRISGERRVVTYKDLMTGDLGGDLDLSCVYEDDGKVVGFVMARRAFFGEPVVKVVLIQILGVDPDYRGKGIATRLVDSVIERCRSKEIKIIRVMLNERDSQLQSLFARMDFRRGQLIEYTRTL